MCALRFSRSSQVAIVALLAALLSALRVARLDPLTAIRWN
jgi:ABC-type antimicrobial peptide transport system permease subunit